MSIPTMISSRTRAGRSRDRRGAKGDLERQLGSWRQPRKSSQAARGPRRLLLDGVEETQEGGVLAEQILDLRDAGTRPILDPVYGKIVSR